MKQYEKPELKTIYDAAYAANCTNGIIVTDECIPGSNAGTNCHPGALPILGECTVGGIPEH